MAETRDGRRAFTSTQKKDILHQQNLQCAVCHQQLDIRVVEFDHIKEWSESGKTVVKNGAALCPTCHRIKTHNHTLKKIDKPNIVKKLATKERLNECTLKQVKFLATKHKIKVNGGTSWDAWNGTTKTTPTKRQYVNKLLGIVHEGEKLQD